jgi:hypothetical protein
MALFDLPNPSLALPMTLDEGYFFQLGTQYLLPLETIPVGSVLTLTPWVVKSMFRISYGMFENRRVALCFNSQFTVINGGGYLITYMNKKDPVLEYNLLVKTPQVVIYNYPNRGALVISPRVSPDILGFIEEQ